ncbi:MAG: sigma-54-dependent transcriptional regulator [Pirellulales bacterium]
MKRAEKHNPYRVLVVDDHARARESVADVLRCAEYEVATCASAIEALVQLAARPVDVVVTDLQMPGMDGLEFIREIERRRLAVQVLMITAHASIASAVEAMRHGAFDYLEKPFDAAALERSVAQACERGNLSEAAAEVSHAGPVLIGSSRAMRELRQRIAQIAPTDETVLVCGESGTGKELVAQTIHAQSRRAERPLVSLNCPVLSAQLTESELFGHKRGAFTGAEADRTGRFELAHGSSILLDEVTEIDLALQAKLLRVLQERTFERVGSSETVCTDVRVLATTNRDLPAEIAAGRFRQDLYFRLAVVPLFVPPLRDREDDVLELADHFLSSASQRLGRGPFDLSAEARDLFAQYEWPGNVRELQNIITRACVLNTGTAIRADELRPWLAADRFRTRQTGPTPELVTAGATLEEVERRLIETTLAQYDGHRAKTAEALGIGLRTLSGKLRQYGYAPREKSFAKTA